MGAADCVHRQHRACQGHQAAEAAAMIEVAFFTYTDKQWNAIKGVVFYRLGLDADLIERPITPTLGNSSITGMEQLRNSIEFAASVHIPRSARESQTPGYKARIRQ